MNVVQIIKQLEGTTKKLEKEAILLEHKDNVLLKELFRLAYSPTINFNLKAIPEYTCNVVAPYWLSHAVSDVFDKFIAGGIRGNKAKEYLVVVLSSLPEDEADILTRIFKGDMKCGVGTNTCNKIWKGLIQKPPRMGASSMNEKTLAKMSKVKNLAIELKSDGSYAATVCGDTPSMMSRNGNPLGGLDSLLEELAHKAFNGCAVEGELVYDLSKATREEGNGIIGKVVKGTASEEERNNVYYQVWDIIKLEDYHTKGKFPVENYIRRARLELAIEESACKFITIIPRTENVSMEEAHTIFEGYVREGYEGAILKDMNAPWADNGKPTCSVKMKRKEPGDLRVVGVYEGKNKAKGMLGGVNLESSCGRIKVNCGSGFSDDQRIAYWEEAGEDLAGLNDKIFETEYDSITKDKKTLQESLFLPIFKRERFDKDEADSYQNLLDKQRIK